MLKYCLDRCKTQEMGDKADWFVTSKTVKKLEDAVFSNNDIVFILVMSHFLVMKWVGGILSVNLNNNLDDANFNEDDPEIIIHDRLVAGCNRSKQNKACKNVKKIQAKN